jgi:hypothetical protein
MPKYSPALRTYFQKKLASQLELADDEGFLQLIWAGNALQSDAEAAAAPYLGHKYPATAVTTDITSPAHMHKWELETLANELLTIPKRDQSRDARVRALANDSLQNLVNSLNTLRKLENQEAARGLDNVGIFREMARIANRQFDWQRGYLNVPQFYRSTFVYGQGVCAAHFEATYGITVNTFSAVGFAMYAGLSVGPMFHRGSDLSALGVTREEMERAFQLLSLPHPELRTLASAERAGVFHTAYRPSVLRRFPCIGFGGGERIYSPLPQLILERVTSGIFYDVVNGSGAVRADYGARFEQYCLAYLRAVLPGLGWEPEREYRVSKARRDTPDILSVTDGEVGLAIECKATRMGYGARFGADVDERGYEDLVKAVVQLWRFFAHSRLGLTGLTASIEAVGAVLTLDGWLSMANPLQTEVMSRASERADADALITPADRRPIGFVQVTALESTLVRATEESFIAAMRAIANPNRHGWALSNVHDDFENKGKPERKYPFKADLGRLLPWWADLGAAKEAKLA